MKAMISKMAFEASSLAGIGKSIFLGSELVSIIANTVTADHPSACPQATSRAAGDDFHFCIGNHRWPTALSGAHLVSHPEHNCVKVPGGDARLLYPFLHRSGHRQLDCLRYDSDDGVLGPEDD